jgi:hypothetical protein
MIPSFRYRHQFPEVLKDERGSIFYAAYPQVNSTNLSYERALKSVYSCLPQYQHVL